MISVIKETSNSVSLISTDCTIDYSVVQSVVLEFTEKSKFTLTDSTPVKANDFLNENKNLYWTIDKTKELEKSGVYDVKIHINKYQTKSISGITEKNIVNGINILLDFYDTNFIRIGDKVYEIDKKRSYIDHLFLKTPVKVIPDNLTYNPVLVEEQCLFLSHSLKEKLNKRITDIPTCDSTDIVQELTFDLFALIRVDNAIACGNCSGAKKIFQSLKNKYEYESC